MVDFLKNLSSKGTKDRSSVVVGPESESHADENLPNNVESLSTNDETIIETAPIECVDGHPVKYTDEVFNADTLTGRAMGLMSFLSKRTGNPIKFCNDVINQSDMLLMTYAKIAKVATREEMNVVMRIVKEIKTISETPLSGKNDRDLLRGLHLYMGWNEAEKSLEEGGSIYDLLKFTNPNFLNKEIIKVTATGSHAQIMDCIPTKRIQENGKYGIMSNMGEILIEPIYDYISHSGYFGRGWHIKNNNLWGAVNERCEWMFPIEYEEIDCDSDGGHILKKCGKYGYCD